MKKLISYFIRGLLIFVPAALTVFAVVWAFTTVDGIFRSLLRINIPGIGLVIILVLIFTIGLLASNFIGRKFFSIIDNLFAKIPLAKLLYSASKDFINAFTGDKRSFDKPVTVELIPGGPRALGFITNDDLTLLSLPGSVAVYMPQSYNFAGQLLIFGKNSVTPLQLDPADTMKFIVSGGVSGN